MSFRTNLLFLLAIFSMFSMGYLCPTKSPEKRHIRSCGFIPDSGPCLTKEMIATKSYQWRYYFNWKMKYCIHFMYGGCGGNENNFEEYGECMDLCSEEYLRYQKSEEFDNDFNNRSIAKLYNHL